MKKLGFCLILASIFAVSASSARADTSCVPIYGGGQTCVQAGNLVIDKKIANPKTNVLVDNLGVNDDKFSPDQIITFQITVKNTGGTKFNTVKVKDIFPQFVDFAAGVGNFDANTKTLSFDVNDLNANETRTFNIVAKVASFNALPIDRNPICVVNQAQATADSQTSLDNAQLCIEKPQVAPTGVETKGGLKVFPPQKVLTSPPTGPEAIPLMALIPTSILGFFLRKKAITS